MVDLAQMYGAGLVPFDRVVTYLYGLEAYDALLQVFSGAQPGLLPPGFGPDLAALRDISDRATAHALRRDDPLAALKALKRAAGFWRQNGSTNQSGENQTLLAEPEQARWREEQALGLGLNAWHQLERGQEYRDDVLRETLPLVAILRQTSDNPDVLISLATAAQAHLHGYFSAGDANIARARTIYRMGRKAGDAGSYLGMAELMLESGDGRDRQTARTALRQATQQLNISRCGRGVPARAHYLLGMLTAEMGDELGDWGQALAAYRRAAQLGSGQAAQALAQMYAAGLGVPQDASLAHDYAQKAAQFGGF